VLLFREWIPSSPLARFLGVAASRRQPCGSTRNADSFHRCGRAQGIGAIRDRCCAASRSLSSRRGSGWRSRKSVWNSPSFLPIVFPPARIGRAFRGNGRSGSIKGSPSFSVSEQGWCNASDADVFRLTNASLQIQPIEPGAGDPGRGTGSVEFPSKAGDAWKLKDTSTRGKRSASPDCLTKAIQRRSRWHPDAKRVRSRIQPTLCRRGY
jgi:hypothetical protein